METNFCIFFFCRDTPHHLKNKRVSHGLSEKTANSILLNAMKMKDPVVEEQPELEAMLVEAIHVNGECFFIYFFFFLNNGTFILPLFHFIFGIFSIMVLKGYF